MTPPDDGTLVSKMKIQVEWGDCDPADIVFYPNYMRWFDAGNSNHFRTAGADLNELTVKYGIVGVPLVHAGADFRAPSQYGDVIELETWIGAWHRKTLEMYHRVTGNGEIRVEGKEIRIWGKKCPDNPRRLRAAIIPDEVRSMFSVK